MSIPAIHVHFKLNWPQPMYFLGTTRSMTRVGHRGIFDINVPRTHRQTYRQTDILHVPEF